MARNDIIDLDPYLEDIEESQLFKYPEAIIDRPYSGERPLDPLKNFFSRRLRCTTKYFRYGCGQTWRFP